MNVRSLLVAVALLAGCQTQQGIYTSGSRAAKESLAASLECKDRRLRGELKTYAESARCSNAKMIQAYQDAGWPYMDLVYLQTAYRLAGAERIDKGELTEAQFGVQMTELATRVVNEVSRRQAEAASANAAAAQANAAQIQAAGMLLAGIGIWADATTPRPAYRAGMPITCSRLGNSVSCW